MAIVLVGVAWEVRKVDSSEEGWRPGEDNRNDPSEEDTEVCVVGVNVDNRAVANEESYEKDWSAVS